MRRKLALFLAILLVLVEFFGIENRFGNHINIQAEEVGILGRVYWNPTDDNLEEVDGAIIRYKGEDSNSGISKREPVRSFNRAKELVKDGGIIYVMTPEEIADDTIWDNMVNGEDKSIILKRDKSTYLGGEDAIVKVAKGKQLTIEGLTLEPDTPGGTVIWSAEGARLTLGEDVTISEGGTIYFEGEPEGRMEITADDLSEKNYILQYQKYPTIDGGTAIFVNSNIEAGEDYFTVTFDEIKDEIWGIEQREKGKIIFYNEPIYNEQTVYISGEGNDNNSGHLMEKPVKSMDRARKIIQDQWNGIGNICICKTVEINTEQTWDYGENIMIVPVSGMMQPMFYIKEGGALTIKNTKVGEKTKSTGSILIEGSLEVDDTAKIINTNIENQGGSVTIDGGEYKSVKNKEGTMVIRGGTFHGENDYAVDNKGKLSVTGGDFTSSSTVINSTGTLIWNGGNIKTNSEDKSALVALSGNVSLLKGKIEGKVSVNFANGSIEIDGGEMEIEGKIITKKTIWMTNSTILNSYEITIDDSSFFVDGAVVKNIQTQEEGGRFSIITEKYNASYVEAEKNIILYPKNGYYIDPQNGTDDITQDGTTPEKPWKTLSYAMERIPDDKDVNLYLMGTIESEDSDMSIEYSGSGSVTIKAYKNMVGAFFEMDTDGVTLTLRNVTLDGGNQVWGKTTYKREVSVCIINQGTFVLEQDARIKGSNITGNGGAITQNGGIVKILGKISDNTVKGNGGGIYYSGGNLIIMENAIIGNNHAGGNGGGLYLQSPTASAIEIEGKIQNNSSGNGGGIYQNGGNLQLSTKAFISGNTASQEGGAIYLESAVLNEKGNLQNNIAEKNGAALYVDETSKVIISGGTIQDNGKDGESIEAAKKHKNSNDIYILGEITIDSTVTVKDVIYLSDNTKPLRIQGENASVNNYIIGYPLEFIGKILIQYDKDDLAVEGIKQLKEKGYQHNQGEEARPNLVINGANIQVVSNYVYLKSVWETDEINGKITAKTFEEACEKLRDMKKGSIIICGQVTVIGEETWDLKAHGISWNPEIKIASECEGINSINVKENAILNLSNIIIDGNQVKNSKGMIYADGGSINIGVDAIIYNGGERGIYINKGTLFMTGGEVRDCQGGGIFNNGEMRIEPESDEKVFISNNTRVGNGNYEGGAGIYNQNKLDIICQKKNSEIQISNNTLNMGNYSNSGGGGLYNSGICTIIGREEEGEKSICFQDNSILGNATTNVGGGAIKNLKGKLYIENTELKGNVADGTNIEGGAMELWASDVEKVEIKECVFQDNVSMDRGGAIEVRTSAIEIRDSIFKNNIAKNEGGAICFRQNCVYEKTIEGTEFIENQAKNGGAIYLLNSGTLQLNQCAFEQNIASGNGGGICGNHNVSSLIIKINETKFRGNTGKGAGGAVYVSMNGELQVKQSVFEENATSGAGGAMYGTGSLNVELDMTNFKENTSNGHGGGGYFYNVTIGIKDCTFMGNKIESSSNASFSGGGIALRGSSVATINNSIFTKNISNYTGGGIHNQGNCSVVNSQITENQVYRKGGGNVSLPALGGGISNEGVMKLQSCHNDRNQSCREDAQSTSYSRAGGIYNTGTFTMIDSSNNENAIKSNRGVYYSGIWSFGGKFYMVNSQNSGNKVLSSFDRNTTGSIAVDNRGVLVMKNSISSDNEESGIYATGTSTIQFEEKSQSKRNKGYGIYMRYDRVIGVGNQVILEDGTEISENTSSGISDFADVPNKIIMNGGDISNNGGNGIEIGGSDDFVMYGGSIKENKKSGVVLKYNSSPSNTATSSFRMYGGMICGNQENGVLVRRGQFSLYAGKAQLEDEVLLESRNYPLQLLGAQSNKNNDYQILLGNGFVQGDPVVQKSETIKDAGLNQKYFRILKEGYGLEAGNGNLLLSRVYFIGTAGKEVVTTDVKGATPRNPYTTWSELKDAIGDKPATIYVCGTMQVEGIQSWTLDEKQKLYRYTGATIAGTDYSTYAFLDGSLVSIGKGASLTMTNISIDGNKFIEQTCETMAPLINIEKGGSLVLGDGALIGNMAADDCKGYADALIQAGGELLLSGTAQVFGAIALKTYTDDSGEEKMSLVTVNSDFTSNLVLSLEKGEPGQVCVKYTEPDKINPNNAAKIIAQYVLTNENYSLILEVKDGEAVVKIADRSNIYVNGIYSDELVSTVDGLTPMTAFTTLEDAYNWIKTRESGGVTDVPKEYIIYMVGAVTLDGSTKYFSDCGYGIDEENMTCSIIDRVSIKRYSKPLTEDAKGWPSSYTGELFKIVGDVTIDNLTIDGHSQKTELEEDGTFIVTEDKVEAEGPLAVIEKDVALTTKGVTIFRNNWNDKIITMSGFLNLHDKTSIVGNVELTGEDSKIMVSEDYNLSQRIPLSVEMPQKHRVVVDYAEEATAQEQEERLLQYSLEGTANQSYSLITSISDNSQIILEKKEAVYLDPINGSDGNETMCSIPEKPVKTLQAAYKAAQNRSGSCIIYIMNPIDILENVSLTQTSYQSGSTTILLSNSSISFLRYVEGEKSNKSTLFQIGENGTLTLQEITIDGQKAEKNKDGLIISGIDVDQAMIIVYEKGKLVINDGTNLQNNRSVFKDSNLEITTLSYLGGAITNYGTLSVNGGNILDNETVITDGINQKMYPAAVMQAGEMRLYGSITLKEQEVYLTNESVIEVAGVLQNIENVLVRMESYTNMRTVAKFSGSAIKDETIVPEVLGKVVLAEETEKYYVTQSTKEEKVAMLRRYVELEKKPDDIFVQMDQGATVTVKLKDTNELEIKENKENMSEIRSILYYKGKKVVLEGTAGENEFLLQGGSITKNKGTRKYKISIPVKEETIGNYEFVLILDGKEAAKTSFVVSAYEWTNEEGNKVDKLSASANKNIGELAQNQVYFKVYNGYSHSIYVDMGEAYLKGYDEYTPDLISASKLKEKNLYETLKEEEANVTFALELEKNNQYKKANGTWTLFGLFRKMAEGNRLQVEASGSASYVVKLLNANALNVNASAALIFNKITLEDICFGTTVSDHSVSIGIETETQNASITVKKDGKVMRGVDVSLERSGNQFVMIEEEDGQDIPTGVYEGNVPVGTYRVMINLEGNVYKGEQVQIENGHNEFAMDYYTVFYEKGAEEAEIKVPLNEQIVAEGTTITLFGSSQEVFRWEGHKITGWRVKGKTEKTLLAGSKYTILEKTVLEGVWEKELPQPTEKPEKSKEPEVSQLPIITNAPVVSQVPIITSTPGITQVPIASTTPVVTSTPEVSSTPKVTQIPIASSTPFVSKTPITSSTPVASKTPIASSTPVVSKTPIASNSPAATNVPIASHTPRVSETPIASGTPRVSATPMATQPPVVTETPNVSQTPVMTDIPKTTRTPEASVSPIPTKETKEPQQTSTPKQSDRPKVTTHPWNTTPEPSVQPTKQPKDYIQYPGPKDTDVKTGDTTRTEFYILGMVVGLIGITLSIKDDKNWFEKGKKGKRNS